MKRYVILVVLAVLVGLVPTATPAAAAPTSSGYVIGSAAPLTPDQVAALNGAGARVSYAYKNSGGANAAIPSTKVAAVRALPFVTSVTADRLRQPTATAAPETAPLPATPYWQDLIDLPTSGPTGAGVWVAVLDTGFYPNWRDYFVPGDILTQHARAFISARGTANVNQWDAGADPHGMAVAAAIVGSRFVDDTNEGGWGTGFVTGAAGTYWNPGVAPDAKIIPVKVCEPIGCFVSAINAGVDHVTSLKKANPTQPIVINESLGGPGLDPVEKGALDAAIAAGVVVVASAGNSGDAGMGFPGAYEPVVSVGAGGWTGQFSNWPSKAWYLADVPETGISQISMAPFSSRPLAGQYLDVVSTGRYLLLPYPCAQLYKDGQVTPATEHRTCASKATPDNAAAAPFQYLFINGTSFSSPTVAGLIARVLQRHPTMSNADAGFGTMEPATWRPGAVERLLEGAATPIPAGSATVRVRTGETVTESWGDDATGHGWVFADDLLEAAG